MNPWKKTMKALSGAVVALVGMAALADAADTNQLANAPGLADLTLEQLANVQVTSVSKKEEKLSEAPAAISVVTQDDIRRLGINNLPDALRLVPGMDVAQIDSHTWAVSARGFEGQFADKLLVMIDGRTVYTSASAGVFWSAQDMVMEDLDRIEVIRGPGATLWGDNAVNGVVNIISKSAKDTQGLLLSQSVDDEARTATTFRYGGELATNLYYRVYGKFFNRDGSVTSSGADASDDWRGAHGGMRLDWEPSVENLFTLQGDFYYDEAGINLSVPELTVPYSTNFDARNYSSSGNVLGRWTHTFSEQSQLSLQAFYTHDQFESGADLITEDTFDVELQDRFGLGGWNDIVWGGGYRLISDDLRPIWSPEKQTMQLFTTFLQDDITLAPDRLHLYLGSKFDHNDQTGFEIQPGARLSWTPTEHQTVWSSVSRAVRVPDRFEAGGQQNMAAFPTGPFSPPAEVDLTGNSSLQAEVLTAYELGYRIQPTKRLSFDVSTFYNVYDHLIDFTANAPYFAATPTPHLVLSQQAENVPGGASYGAELAAQWQAGKRWRLAADYGWLREKFAVRQTIEANPQQQVGLRSYLDLPWHTEFNASIAYLDSLPNLNVPSYIRLDLALIWHATRDLEFGIFGQNLVDGRHLEFPSPVSSQRTEIARSVMGKITWRF